MATARLDKNVVMGPVSLIPVSNKLQDRMNILREVIDSKKSLVRKVSDEMKQLIEEKAQLIIGELEAVWDETNQRLNKRKDEVNKKIEAINKQKTEMEKLFKDLSPTLPGFIDQIPEAIETVKREMNIDIPFLKLNWKVDELRESIHSLCYCEQKFVNFEEHIPIPLKWSCGDEGKLDNQLDCPCGIAIDSMNDRVYVTDYRANRVQVFSGNGDWIKSIKDKRMINLENILILYNSVFVQCHRIIVKFNRSTLKIESSKFSDYSLSGICTDNTNVFVGEYSKMTLLVLTLELKEEKEIPLNTQFKQQDTEINNISLARHEFYILLNKTEYPIQAFSKQGMMTRWIIHKDMLGCSSYFCLDQQLNIIVFDPDSCKVKIFSNEGNIITQFGREEFISVAGIAVDDLCSIVTVDSVKGHNKLQAFSHH
ncbi:hypothetical protein LOD99_2970 [Oopsacas minuta]|uniref:Uncharacterized protein n=1 Tax=Oopsacas minuta TaxID=111878 RepID=A0AAV7K052_9METZ|nr:hypothetical protein LOD99_2970 [Oopsacas minuta]